MNTHELICRLRMLDPTGDLEVTFLSQGDDIFDVSEISRLGDGDEDVVAIVLSSEF